MGFNDAIWVSLLILLSGCGSFRAYQEPTQGDTANITFVNYDGDDGSAVIFKKYEHCEDGAETDEIAKGRHLSITIAAGELISFSLGHDFIYENAQYLHCRGYITFLPRKNQSYVATIRHLGLRQCGVQLLNVSQANPSLEPHISRVAKFHSTKHCLLEDLPPLRITSDDILWGPRNSTANQVQPLDNIYKSDIPSREYGD